MFWKSFYEDDIQPEIQVPPPPRVHDSHATTLLHPYTIQLFYGCGIGPLLVLVSPCFRENVVVTCKIGSFLCSLVTSEKRKWFLFWKSNFKMALIWKKGYFWPTFHIFSHQGKVTKIPSAHYLTLIHTCILLTLLTFFFFFFFFALPVLKKIRIYQVWFLFGMSPGPYFIKVKIILSLKFKINLIFYLIMLIKEFMKHSCLNFFYEIVNKISIKVNMVKRNWS